MAIHQHRLKKKWFVYLLNIQNSQKNICSKWFMRTLDMKETILSFSLEYRSSGVHLRFFIYFILIINLATILTIINLAKCIDRHIYLAQQRIHLFDCIAALAKYFCATLLKSLRCIHQKRYSVWTKNNQSQARGSSSFKSPRLSLAQGT